MMNWQWKKIKTYWLLINFVLLAFACLMPLGLEGFWGDLAGICSIALFIQSYPLIFLPAYLLVWSGIYDNAFILMILIGPMSFALGYLQWFIIVPRLVKYFRQTFFRYDLQINLSANVTSSKMLPAANLDFAAQDWQKSWYDEQKRTPVERIFEKDES